MDTSFETRDNCQEWLTPPEIIEGLGEFDLDPCSPINRPWDTAKKHYTIEDDGLKQEWNGRVFLNPPYGRQTPLWLEKMVEHGEGIVLIYARTDTIYWHNYVWNCADAIFFFKGRIKFYYVDGRQGGTPGAPSVLIAYGKENVLALKNFTKREGKLILLK